MSGQTFDKWAMWFGARSTRRSIVSAALAVGSGRAAFGPAAKGATCREAAAICNGNVTCCGSLQCMPIGIGNQHRCLEPLPPPPPPT